MATGMAIGIGIGAAVGELVFGNIAIGIAVGTAVPGTHIEISLKQAASKAVAMISDNGAGIPVDERDKVFRRLYRLDKSRTTSGSGLGLSLVSAIADLHGGHVILADNNPGVMAEIALPVMSYDRGDLCFSLFEEHEMGERLTTA
jgi:signal transduction histidine kinase